MIDELKILYYDSIYPVQSVAYVRTFNMAKLASNMFNKTTIHATDENYVYNNRVSDIHLLQESKFRNSLDKALYYLKAAISNEYGLKTGDTAFKNKKNSLYQMEGPYFYNTLVKNKISKYIIDEHNVYWEMKAFPSYNINDKLYNIINSKRDKYLEIKALKNALHIFVCSFADKEKILNEIPNIENNISIIPNCINYAEFKNNDDQKPQNGNNKKYKILFMGLLSYAPNVDAIHSICRYIAPKVSNADFYIIGRDPPKINKPDNVKFLGYVDDIKSYINNSDVCLAPLKYGSGTRFKILEYMAMGKPIISTSKGAEGIDYTDNVDIYIEDDITKYADRLKDILLDDEYLKIGLNARNLVRTKYDWGIYKSYINNVYKNILEN